MALRDRDVISVRGAGTLRNSGPLHDRVYNWLLTICAMPHAALVADLHKPTIRKRPVAFHDVLTTYGHSWLHERALGVLGRAQPGHC